jgi:F-type H+-transporting ATPase subunit delta
VDKESTLKKFAKKLADLSVEDGLVSAEKVQAVLAALRKHPPRKPKTVLKHYLYYIKQEINRSRAVIEYAGQIGEAGIAAIGNYLSKNYNRTITTTTVENEDLIAGFRISIGDDIFDASVAGRLNNLAKSVR